MTEVNFHKDGFDLHRGLGTNVLSFTLNGKPPEHWDYHSWRDGKVDGHEFDVLLYQLPRQDAWQSRDGRDGHNGALEYVGRLIVDGFEFAVHGLDGSEFGFTDEEMARRAVTWLENNGKLGGEK